MRTLENHEIYQCICEKLCNTHEKIMIVSAFCKAAAFLELEKKISKEVKEKILVVRFQYQDIISGVSDMELYPLCKRYGWKLFFQLNLHAKMYLFDRRECVMGSANLTRKGMGIRENGNIELACEYEIDLDGIKKIDQIINSSVELTDKIYEIMQNSLTDKEHIIKCKDWGKEIKELFEEEIDVIFMSELPQKKYDTAIEDEYSDFFEGKAYYWLLTQFRKTGKNELYFGELTAALHRDIIQEPKPYRKDVKELLENLLDWVENLGCECIKIDVPNYSTRVTYVDEHSV